MKTIVLWCLVALNAILLYSLVGITPVAQAAGPYRTPDYLIIPGVIQGSPSETVYIVDTTDGILGGMEYDAVAKQLKVLPAISLPRVFAAGAR